MTKIITAKEAMLCMGLEENVEYYHKVGKSDVGIILFHEIFGFDSYIASVADQLYEEGFNVIAVDLYSGKKARSLEEGMALRSSVTYEKFNDVVNKAITQLRLEKNMRKVGSMGFCMGGGFALRAAYEFGLDFCVDFYGMYAGSEEVSQLKGPVLIVLASKDERINNWAFEKFLPSACKNDKRIEVQIYPNSAHAFHRPNWEGYNSIAAKDAWDKAIRFLRSL